MALIKTKLLNFIQHHKRLETIYLNFISRRFKQQSPFSNLKFLNDDEAIDQIISRHKSLARFGDGEFRYIIGEQNVPTFQKQNKQLGQKLKQVIDSDLDNLMVGIPKALKSIRHLNFNAARFWSGYVKTHADTLNQIIPSNKIYTNASLTRFYMDYKDKQHAKQRVNNLKKIWDNRRILIVEGKMTKLGVGNNLLDNAKSVKRIICPTENAFSKYEQILTTIHKHANKNTMILLSLGPTATVLAYDLAKKGYQAVDIGHIDIEYEWLLRGSTEKVAVPNKYTNEAAGGRILSEPQPDQPDYLRSIVAEIA